MDYETPDGSQFSLREIWREDGSGRPTFDYTTVSAYVEGIAYTGRLSERVDAVDDADVLDKLEPVPVSCIHPVFSDRFMQAPSVVSSDHYLKAPSYSYEDCLPGNTIVADCFLNEILALERLRVPCHPNIVKYHGVVVKDGLVTHICLQRYRYSLAEFVDSQKPTAREIARIIDDIHDGLTYVHSFGLAHNDINPENICIDAYGRAVIVDFDSCLPFDARLVKGMVRRQRSESEVALSDRENDKEGLREVEHFLEDYSRRFPQDDLH